MGDPAEIPDYYINATPITSFAEVDEVLRSRSFEQAQHEESADFVGGSVIVLDGDEHFERRRLEAALFARSALKAYEVDALEPMVRDRLRSLPRGTDGRVRADLVVLTRTMLLQVAARISGIDGVESPSATERFRHLVEGMGRGATVELARGDHEQIVQRALAIREAFVHEFYGPSRARRELAAERRSSGVDVPDPPDDLLALLVRETDPSWDDELPLREVTLFLIAATQTSTHATEHLVGHLLDWFDDHPGDRDRIQDDDFLREAIAESLRLHPPAPALARRAVDDVALRSSGRIVQRGEVVALFLREANRDVRVFGPDADRYDPTREPGLPRVKLWGHAFGGGAHLCVGRSLAVGLPARDGGEAVVNGLLMTIARAVFAAGVRLDPDQPPVVNRTSYHDAFETLPVVFDAL